MGSFTDSKGNKVSKQTIDARVRKAKEQKLKQFIDEHGYAYCEECKRNDCKPVDCSHNVSVDQCQKDLDTPLEWAWDVDMITLRGRKCHQLHDKLY